ncbi:hypothetical protein [Aureimonas sp. Leaf454]|uniref:hypothetical protein n=1 Tax=Aureimonas sp. Leaf454 TaxID=1736381 RepID=UPI0012E3D3D7|nr:hypothetical protein [Aureimonas sp. Leaf454]
MLRAQADAAASIVESVVSEVAGVGPLSPMPGARVATDGAQTLSGEIETLRHRPAASEPSSPATSWKASNRLQVSGSTKLKPPGRCIALHAMQQTGVIKCPRKRYRSLYNSFDSDEQVWP